MPPLEVATPAILPQPPQKSSMGHHEAGNLAVFLNNRGEVTAYSPTGHKLWQVPLPFMALSDGGRKTVIKETCMIVTRRSPVSSCGLYCPQALLHLCPRSKLLLVGRLSPSGVHRLQQSPNY